ncbi:MAG: peptidylprolyl isomerase [Candidatus Hodarchaeales archaeon]
MTKGIMETNKGTIELEFFDDDAPNTVKNFVSLAQKGFYDGLTFHRVIDDFVIQGGDPKGTGTGGPGYAIPCETNGGNQKHVDGALSMAHAGRNTGGSQFFVVLNPKNCSHLDRKHTVFGKVTNGLDVVQKIRQGDKMTKVTVSDVSDNISNLELKTLPGRR